MSHTRKGLSRGNRRYSFQWPEGACGTAVGGKPPRSRRLARHPGSAGSRAGPRLTIMACCTRVLLCSHMFFRILLAAL